MSNENEKMHIDEYETGFLVDISWVSFDFWPQLIILCQNSCLLIVWWKRGHNDEKAKIIYWWLWNFFLVHCTSILLSFSVSVLDFTSDGTSYTEKRTFIDS
jgi:hypothetical protein